MATSKSRELFIAAAFAILGTIIGAVTTGYVNASIQKQQRQAQVAMDSFKYDQMAGPVEFQALKQLLDEMRNLSSLSAETIAKLTDIQKRYPNCGAELSERCRPALVKTIEAMREEMGANSAKAADIDTILAPKYAKAQKALDSLNGRK